MKDQTKMTRRLAGMLHARIPEAGLEKVADPRPDDKRKKWKLEPMLRGAVAGVATGAQSCGETEALTSEMSRSGRRLLGIGRRIPDTTLRAVLTKIAPEELRKCLRRQTKSAHRRRALEPVGLPFGMVSGRGKVS